MPKHVSKFPEHVRDAVRDHVERAIARVSPLRYRQEPAYVAALANALEGNAYEDTDAYVRFESTVVDDTGPSAAEHVFGADIAITATIRSPGHEIAKAILIQAKLGYISDLRSDDRSHLNEQFEKMKKLTRCPKVMEIPEVDGRRVPAVISGTRLHDGDPYRPMPLASYFTARVLTTLDGDTRRRFVERVQNSRLTTVHVLARRAGRLPQ